MRELRTSIKHEGQRFYDEPVLAYPKKDAIRSSVAVAFGHERWLPKPVVIDHQRVRLRWVKPDGNGGFVPK